jgi:hypothetical protein
MMRRGWLTGFHPEPADWDRPMVFVPQRDDYAAIIRCIDARNVGVVPRGLIESRTQQPADSIGTGMFLGHVGIGIARIDGNNVFVRATNPGMAMMAYSVRRGPLERMPVETLIHVTTGTHIPRPLWNDDLRLRVALAFDEFCIDVPGVLDDNVETDVRSRWLSPPPPPPPPPPWTQSQPPTPAAPINPDMPPF